MTYSITGIVELSALSCACTYWLAHVGGLSLGMLSRSGCGLELGCGALVDGRPQPKTMTVTAAGMVNARRAGVALVVIARLSGCFLTLG